MQKINVIEQFAPNSVISRPEFTDSSIPVMETPLQHANLKKLSVRTGSDQGVVLIEQPVTGLLVMRARSDIPALQSALTSVLNVALPVTLQSNTGNADSSAATSCCVRWVAPDEWMLSCPLNKAFEIENALRESIGDKSVAIVNVSGGFTALELIGPHASDVLKKSTGYDVHPSNLTPGKVVNTVFAKAQVTLRCIDTGHYEILVRRSFADYVWHWLQVASGEYGLGISAG